MKTLLLAYLPDNPDEAEYFLKDFSGANNISSVEVKLLVFLNGFNLPETIKAPYSGVEFHYLASVLPPGKLLKLIFAYSTQKEIDFVLPLNLVQYKYFQKVQSKVFSNLEDNLCFVAYGEHVKKYLGWLNWLGKKVLKRKANFFTKFTLFYVTYLDKVPYHLNSDTSFFNYDILIQHLISGYEYKVVEEDVPIKISLRDKIKITFVLLRAYLHSIGIFHQNKFDVVKENQQYSLKLGYASSHSFAIGAIPSGSNVVDIGAGPYGIGHELKKRNCTVVTIDQYDIPDEYKLDNHIVANLNADISFSINDYDCILFLDILEHLEHPEKFLLQLSNQFGHRKQKIVLTTGNIAFFPLRILLFLGYFNYGKSGILDKTHTRLFTFRSFKKLITESGLVITKVRGIPAPYPKAIGFNIISRTLLAINAFLIGISRKVFAYQIYIEAETLPSVFYMLKNLDK